MSTITEQKTTTQVYRVFIKAPQQKVWDAITTPEWTDRYGYGGKVDYELKKGGAYRHYPSDDMIKGAKEAGFSVPDVVVDGEVLEADPPNRLVHTWHFMMDPSFESDKVGTITYELHEDGGVTRLTLIHELEGAPVTAEMVSGDADPDAGGGGWSWVLSDLKSVLETGKRMSD